MSELTRDIRCYLTNAGRKAELDALKNGTVLEIVSMVIDSALLPDDQDPKDLTAAISPIADAYPIMVNTDGAKGKISFLSDIPSSAGMFTINGFAWMTNTGVLYAYARGLGDVKRPAGSGQNDVLRIEAELLTENATVINHTYDDSQIYATHFELNELVRLHIAASDPHRQYERKDNGATNDDIDNQSTAEKHIKLPQFWRAFLGFITNQWNGDKTDIAVSQKGVTDGLATKTDKSTFDNHHHDDDYYLKHQSDLSLANKIDKTSVTDSINSSSSVLVASAKAIKTVKDIANAKWTYVTATTGRYGATLLSNSYIGTSQTKAVTEKALSEGLEAMRAKKYKMVSMVGNGMVPKTYMPDSGDTGRYAYGILVNDAAMGSTGIIRINAKTGQWCKFHHIMMGQYANTVFITKLIIDGTVVSQGQNLGFDRSEEASRDNSFNLFMTMYWRTIEIHWKAVESSPSYNDILAGWADYEVES